MNARKLKNAACMLAAWSLATIGAEVSAGEKDARPIDLSAAIRQPDDLKSAKIDKGSAVLSHDKWGFLLAKEEHADCEVQLSYTIREPARQFAFFGQSWSAWPDPAFGDQGYEAGVVLRAGAGSGYRVQWSHKYQDVALVKYPDGGYVQVVPCPVKLREAQHVIVRVQANQIVVSVDGQERIRYQDNRLPLSKGMVGIGVSSDATVAFEAVTVKPLPPGPAAPAKGKHVPKLSSRKWLGDRTWVFDGDQPILQLHTAQDPSCFARLKPGYKPQLTFDSHWGIENQGAFKEGASTWTAPVVVGRGKTLKANWSARHVKGRFTTRSALTVGYDAGRDAYTYDIASELEVLPGEPFHFPYGYDFEHHTPLDPFRWQYLVVRGSKGKLYHRPVHSVDPGPMKALSPRGLRLWHGRHGEPMHVAPAVEYDLEDAGQRELSSTVCAAFYDTGIYFGPETAKPGTTIKVKYRYTGYPADEARALFKESVVYPSRMLDPEHHYIFAEEWPKLTFNKFEAMSKTWIHGRRAFMTAHNARPTYELAKETGVGSGFAMKLGPNSYGKADPPLPGPLRKGRYVVTALVRSEGAVGPGGRIELTATQAKTGKVLLQTVHYLGNGSFGWKRAGFAFTLADEAAGLALGLGNAGTGEVHVAEVEFREIDEGAPLPDGVVAQPDSSPPKYARAPDGALADYRMSEQKGHFVFDHAGGLGHLELANVGWTVDEGRPALRFADNPSGRADYPRGRNLDVNYLGNPQFAERKNVSSIPVAIAGFHGGGMDVQGMSLTAWVKPAAAMGGGEHGGFGDIMGFGARRFILRLAGAKAPYRLAGSVNNAANEAELFESNVELEADRWHHVALTAEATAEKKWRVRLYLDGKQVHEATSKKVEAPLRLPPSLILGAELFYLHDAYYRGLIGGTTVFDRALSAERIAELADRSRR